MKINFTLKLKNLCFVHRTEKKNKSAFPIKKQKADLFWSKEDANFWGWISRQFYEGLVENTAQEKEDSL